MNRDELIQVVAAVRNDVLEQVVLAEDLSRCSSPSERSAKRAERAKRVAKANGLIDRFVLRQVSDEPFETPEQAIQALAPIAVWIFGYLARQFAIMVIRAVWDSWNRRVDEQ